MKEIDFKLAVTSAVLLDKDLNYIARLIRRAHDLGFQTGHLKGIVLDHFILVNNDEKYHRFIDLLIEQKIYRNRDIKESLTCASLIKIDNVDITRFISHKPNTLIVQWVQLAKQLIKKDGQIIFTQSQLNFILIFSQVFDFKLPRFDFLFEILLNAFEEISLENLKTILTMFEQLVNTIPKKYLLEIRIKMVIGPGFLKKINKKNKKAATLIIQFVSKVNPSSGFMGPTSSIQNEIKHLELCTLLNRMNSKKVNEFYEQFKSVFSEYEKDQSRFISFFEFLNSGLESQDCQVAQVHCYIWFFLRFISQIPPIDIENTTDSNSKIFQKLLQFMFENDNVDYEYALASIILALIGSKVWCLLLIALDYMDAKGVVFKSIFYTFLANAVFLQLPDRILEKFYSTIVKSRLKTYQKFYAIDILSYVYKNRTEQFDIFISEQLFGQFSKLSARKEIVKLGHFSFDSKGLAQFDNLKQFYTDESILTSLDHRLKIEYLASKMCGNSDNLFPDCKDFNNFMEYVAGIDNEKLEKCSIDLTKIYVEKLIKMINSDELCDCLSGIAARLAMAELDNHLKELFDVVSSLQLIPGDLHHNLLLSMLKRVTSAAIDVSSFQSLIIVTKVCKTLLAVERNGQDLHEQSMNSSDSLQTISNRFVNSVSSIAKKATRYLIIYSLQCPSEEPLSIMTSFQHGSIEIIQKIWG